MASAQGARGHFQRGRRVNTGSAHGRSQSKQDAGKERADQTKAQDANVRPQIESERCFAA